MQTHDVSVAPLITEKKMYTEYLMVFLFVQEAR